MANFFTQVIWKPFEVYQGIQIFDTRIKFYAARCGPDVKASTDLNVVHEFIDAYLKTKSN